MTRGKPESTITIIHHEIDWWRVDKPIRLQFSDICNTTKRSTIVENKAAKMMGRVVKTFTIYVHFYYFIYLYLSVSLFSVAVHSQIVTFRIPCDKPSSGNGFRRYALLFASLYFIFTNAFRSPLSSSLLSSSLLTFLLLLLLLLLLLSSSLFLVVVSKDLGLKILMYALLIWRSIASRHKQS